jgi:hypothetical protein
LWVPVGFGHAFCTLEPNSVISYRVTSYYSPENDKGVAWDDPEIGVDWPDVAGTMMEWTWHPRFAVLLHGRSGSSPEQVEASAQSVMDQIYPSAAIINGPDGSLARAITADSDYLVPLRIGDRLSKTALFQIAEALQIHRGAAILYGDQDEVDELGERRRPWFKPRWNRELFLAQDYISGAMAIDMALAREAARSARNVTELAIEASSTNRPVVHVPHILCHLVQGIEDRPHRLTAVSRALEPLGARCIDGPFGTVKVEWPLPQPLPLVSIIVPTKDKLELLQPCIESVLEQTDYDQFEIVIVDNGSVEERTADYLAAIGKNSKVRVIAYPHDYNFSAINNFAAHEARGTFLCLLNNDTEVVNAGWLTELMRYAVREDIGAAGAKLLYDDGTIQHAGVVIGIGDAAGHAHRFLPGHEPGYFCQPHAAHEALGNG